ncbi:glycine cleavage system aminomethyltransferase GcvT [Amphibacillus cookii]|uniref:glycine cleavage system aminomethyltransferase GcvT n=1 Tax=Amphibacillus cookii TaxID=767787 RepID=UPI00195780F3|nr:glycine cleavage system aminomethyltransferase GcvT [Amphibacillus cookii]MBM7541627.1 aminomethyltransferase [Amphibacillus cookii]
MSDKPLKQTPLFSLYQSYGAKKIIDYGGWALPVHFSSIIDEHHAVRQKAGLFDVSHMGEICIEGKAAEKLVNLLMTNDITSLEINQARYTAMCYQDGGTVDDLLVYKLADQKFLLVVNAANIDKDLDWIHSHRMNDVTITNLSEQIAQLAIQGPEAVNILQKLTDTNLTEIKPFRFVQNVQLADITNVLVSRTGYTGEDGFELYAPHQQAQVLWRELLRADDRLQPCGLGARDTLRFEAKLALYGQELSSSITPFEAGIGFTVKIDKSSDFIGKAALTQEKQNQPARKLVGLEIIDKGIPRHGYKVFSSSDQEIGFITSGTHSPTIQKHLGLALVQAEYAKLGTEVQVQIRSRLVNAVVVETPFYKRK